MDPILREDLEGGVTRLRLSSGSGNALGPAAVDALATHVAALLEAPPRALLLDGGAGKIFSGGFDLTVIADFERAELAAFFSRYMEAIEGILRLDCPSVAAIHGSAIAGGFILSLAPDLRVVQRGRLKLGLSEVDLGVAVPWGAQVLLAERTRPQLARYYSVTAELFGPEEARRIGYADVLADDAQAEALALSQRLAATPGRAAAVCRGFEASGLADRVMAATLEGEGGFLDTWFSPEGQASLKGLAARLSGRG